MPPLVDIPVTDGVTYYIAVDGYDGTVGNIILTVADLGAPAVLPPGAVGFADFANGGYIFDGVPTTTAADVLNDPEFIIPGIGLFIADDADPVQFIGDFATYLLAADFTVVLEWYRIDGFACPLHIADSADDLPRFSIEDEQGAGAFDFFTFDWVPAVGERDVFRTGNADNGVINVCAVTRTNAKISASFNGSAFASTVAGQATFAAGVNTAYIGGTQTTSFGPMVLGKIVIYPPQLDADLAALAVADTLAAKAPANDNFADAIEIDLDEVVTGHNFFATSEGEDLPDGAGHSIWYRITVPSSADYTFDMTGSDAADYNGFALAIYTGTSLGDIALWDWDSTYPFPVYTTFLDAGEYFIALDCDTVGVGTIQLVVTAA